MKKSRTPVERDEVEMKETRREKCWLTILLPLLSVLQLILRQSRNYQHHTYLFSHHSVTFQLFIFLPFWQNLSYIFGKKIIIFENRQKFFST